MGLLAAMLAGCSPEQSVLHPAGRDAEGLTALTWFMFAAAVVIWGIVMGAAIYAVVGKKRPRSEKFADTFILIGGVAFPTVGLAVLLVFGLSLLPSWTTSRGTYPLASRQAITASRVAEPGSRSTKGVPIRSARRTEGRIASGAGGEEHATGPHERGSIRLYCTPGYLERLSEALDEPYLSTSLGKMIRKRAGWLTLLFFGYPPVTANVSNSLGLVAGGMSGAWGYRHEIRGLGSMLARLAPVSLLGSVIGAVLLLVLPPAAFEAIVPVLILLGVLLVIFGPRINAWARGHHTSHALTPGQISVWSGDGEGICYFGELIAIGMKERGCVGALVDGGIRDVRWIGEQDFPVYARYRTPVQSIGRWKVTASQVPVYLKGATTTYVEIKPGDFILADEDGAIVIPAEVVEKTLAEAESLTQTEVKIRAELGKGMTLAQALEQYGHV